MPAHVTIQIPPLKLPLVGVEGIDVLVNEQPVAGLTFGESVTVSVEPGTRAVALSTRGVITRRSNTLTLELQEGEQVNLSGKYSRLWGTFKLSSE